ncbi:hypothetical protein [Flavobacterium weaverense]|uniref:Uncharacterized protein n=1 Tax=Flavobacterium weaverense TaxID=271156 RepID=A0A3L9ZWI0_9FLAO|nr:hypothetical protein [Flavobacterium weaverense]RMA74858.1 hypothetical protein BC961_2189 [Flavobacterium weaverense]
MTILKRAKAPTPKFFKLLRTIGLVMAGVGGSIMAAPVVLPLTIVTLAGYFTVAGGVLSAVSQLTSDHNSELNARE